MHHNRCECTHKLNAEIPVGNAVNAVERDSVKSELLGDEFTVCIVCCTRKGAGAERRIIHPLHSVLKPSDITDKHHSVSQKMMSKGYRLSTLKMSISGQNRVFIILGNGKYGSKQILDKRNNLFRLVSEIKTDINGNLIVTASRRVELLADVAYTLCQLGLNEHMNILGVHIELKSAAVKVVKYRLKAGKNLVAIVVGDDFLHCKHCCMLHRTGYILLIHLAVKMDRRIEIIGFLIQFLGKPACPHLFHSL